VTERIERLESGKDNPTTEITLIRQDGIRIIVESTSTSILIDGITTAAIIARDISERKKLETKLKESEERFRAFTDNIPATVYIKDENDRHIYANPEGLKSVKRKYDEFIGSTTQDLWPSQIADRLIELDRKVIHEGIPKITEEWSDTEEGEIRWRRDIKFPINLQTGKKLLGGFALDITELKLAENALKELMKLDQLLARLSVSFIDLPVDKTDTAIDDALEQIGRFLGLDRCSFGHLTPDGKEMRVTHVWNRKPLTGTRMSYALNEYPWLLSPFRTGETLVWSRTEGMPTGSEVDVRLLEESGMQFFAGIPVKVAGEPMSCLGFSDTTGSRTWDSQFIERFSLIAGIFGHLIARRQADLKLQDAFKEIKELKDRLEQENIYLREEITLQHRHHEVVGQSDPIKRVLSTAEQVAGTDSTVLIQGETGTGKELIARVIHNLSSRDGRAMVKVNCAALPSTLVESELFGREKGAYTGALSKQIGRFEIADGSTIFLDEIGDLLPDLQGKLLRVLEGGEFERLGSPKAITVNVRVIAATNRDLAELVRAGKFREDLYYRLSVFPIDVPPLRERTEDIPPLVWSFVQEFETTMGKRIEAIPRKGMEALQQYPWPGNVRELRNVIEQAMILSRGKTLNVQVPGLGVYEEAQHLRLEDMERNHITAILERTGWRVSGKRGAAEILGLKPTTLESKMKKLGIKRPAKDPDIL
jgi:PAS domain S-box-containing protein